MFSYSWNLCNAIDFLWFIAGRESCIHASAPTRGTASVLWETYEEDTEGLDNGNPNDDRRWDDDRKFKLEISKLAAQQEVLCTERTGTTCRKLHTPT
jgi:hypothetical protein